METLVENGGADLFQNGTPVPEWIWLASGELMAARRLGQGINFLGEAHEDECYSFDESYVVETGGRYYLVHTSGCSCQTPEENACLTAGPAATLGGLFDELHVNSENGKKYVPATAKRAFVDAIQRLNEATVLATKKALGLV